MRRSLPTDPCVAGKHDQCQGAEDGGSVYPGDVYLCTCSCHDYDELNVQIAMSRMRSGGPCPLLSAPERRAVAVQLTEAGWTAREIADAMGVCVRSVGRYRANGSTQGRQTHHLRGRASS